MARILVVYSCRGRLRASQRDNLFAFGKYPGHEWYYFNAAFRRMPDYLLRVPWDLVIFHWQFIAMRGVSESDRQLFNRLVEGVRPLAQLDCPKAVLPQDEFQRMDLVDQFIADFRITHVFSVAAPALWPTLYRDVDFARVKFERVLTGYLDSDVVARYASKAFEAQRPIDIGYRTGTVASWGRLNLLKQELADRVLQAGSNRPYVLDIKCGWQHFVFGDAWFDFLQRCRWFLGVEGGASLFDRDGSLWAKVAEFTRQHPNASYEEIEAACFPGRDGEIDLRALSPRHLEACATGTAQLLIEGEYNGILRPGEHYLPIRPDFSNLEEVLDGVADESTRRRLVERAFDDVVRSGRYSYADFVRTVLASTIGSAEASAPSKPNGAEREARLRNDAAESLSWQKVGFMHGLRGLRDRLRRIHAT